MFYLTGDMGLLVAAAAETIPGDVPDRIPPDGMIWIEEPFDIEGEIIVMVSWLPDPIFPGGVIVNTYNEGEYGDITPLQMVGYPARDDKPHSADYIWLLRWVRTFWIISEQRIAAKETWKPDRATRRGWTRLGRPGEPPDIIIVTLRRQDHVYDKDGDSQPINWTHRWLVDGHWRRIRDKETGEVKLTWVSTYIKGPEHLPFKPKRRVFDVRR